MKRVFFLALLCSCLATAQPEPVPHPAPPSRPIILRFAGDCLLTDYYEQAAGTNVNLAFEGFDLMKKADIAMVNLECPVTTRGEKVPKPFNFRMNPRFLRALTDAGIKIVNLANNHIFDYGKQGLFDTISYLDSVGIRHVGAGRDLQEARRPVIITVGGRKIAFLAYYGGGEAPPATRSGPGVAGRDLNTISADLRSLRERDSVQFIVVTLHWGTEKAELPDRSQVEFAHGVIGAGADVVIGHHSHVLQGIERYKNGVIVYSLGNFIFGGNGRDTYDTGIFEVRLIGKSAEYEFIPIRVTGWTAKRLTGEEADRVTGRVRRLSGKFPKTIFTKQSKERK